MKRSTARMFLAAIALASGWLAWIESRVAHERTLASTVAADRLERWRIQLDDVRARNGIVRRHRQEVEDQLARLRATAHGTAVAAPKSRDELNLELLMDPGMQAILAKRVRLVSELDHAALFHRLGWTPDQISQLGDLIAENTAQRSDIYGAADALGLGYSSPEIASLVQAKKDELAAAERQLMDPAAFTQLQDFDRSEQERRTTDQLARDLLFTATPLTEAPAEALTETLRTARGPTDATGLPGEIDWDQATRQAAAYLSPPQLDEFKSAAAATRVNQLQMQLVKMIRGWEATLPPPTSQP